jgi:hypothetical protein
MPLNEVLEKYGFEILFAVVAMAIIGIVLWMFAPAGWMPGANIFQFLHSGLAAFANALGIGTETCNNYRDSVACMSHSDCMWDPGTSTCKRSIV